MVYGHSTSYPADVAHAGETIVLRVSMSRHGVYVAVIDKTHRFTVSRTGGACCLAGGGWTGDAVWWPGGSTRFEGVPDFGKLTYTNSKVNGRSLDSAPALSRYELKYPRSTPLRIATGPISSGGETFSTYFKHS
jgi:hypothetical protein